MMEDKRLTFADVRNRREQVRKEMQRVEQNITYQTNLLFRAEASPQNTTQKWTRRVQYIVGFLDSAWAGYKLLRKLRDQPIFSSRKRRIRR